MDEYGDQYGSEFGDESGENFERRGRKGFAEDAKNSQSFEIWLRGFP